MGGEEKTKREEEKEEERGVRITKNRAAGHGFEYFLVRAKEFVAISGSPGGKFLFLKRLPDRNEKLS